MKTLLLTILFSTTAMAQNYVSKVDSVVAMESLTSVNTMDEAQCSLENLINSDESGIYSRMANRMKAIHSVVVILSKEIKVNPCMVLSMIAQESGFKADATSNKKSKYKVKAKGLMQVISLTRVSVIKNLGSKFNLMITKNLDSGLTTKELDSLIVGMTYFKSLMKKFKNNSDIAVIAYNEGPSRVQTWINNKTPFGKKHNHLIKIKENMMLVSLN